MTIADFLGTASEVLAPFQAAIADAAPYILGLLAVTLTVGIGMALLGRGEKKIKASVKG